MENKAFPRGSTFEIFTTYTTAAFLLTDVVRHDFKKKIKRKQLQFEIVKRMQSVLQFIYANCFQSSEDN